MPVSTKYANPQSALAFRQKSSSARQNSVEGATFTDLNTLDDDINRLETLLGVGADTVEAAINYSSNIHITDGTDLITAISALDAAIGTVSLASTTEVLAGTDTAKAVTADALAAIWEQAADTVAASTLTVPEGGYVNITGTTNITGFSNAGKSGRTIRCRFVSSLVLTHHATSFILLSGGDITVNAGDIVEFTHLGSGNWRMTDYVRAAANPSIGAYRLIDVQIFTTTGANTWTKPAGTTACDVENQAGGGGGSFSNTASTVFPGGGGGAYYRKFITSGLGTTETATVGVGGTAGTSGAVAGDGGTSSFGTHIVCTGGIGGPASSGVQGGAGGTVTTGTGGWGMSGQAGGAHSVSGAGGNSFLGLGAAPPPVTTNGNDGTGYGSGGSGANGTSNRPGGAGRPGIIIARSYTNL